MQLCLVQCAVSLILKTGLQALDVLPTKSERQNIVTAGAPTIESVSKALLMACLHFAVLVVVFGVPCMGDGRILVLHAALRWSCVFSYFTATALLSLDVSRVRRRCDGERFVFFVFLVFTSRVLAVSSAIRRAVARAAIARGIQRVLASPRTRTPLAKNVSVLHSSGWAPGGNK